MHARRNFVGFHLHIKNAGQRHVGFSVRYISEKLDLFNRRLGGQAVGLHAATGRTNCTNGMIQTINCTEVDAVGMLGLEGCCAGDTLSLSQYEAFFRHLFDAMDDIEWHDKLSVLEYALSSF